ncbi:MAG: prolipoprotein diacylglyceryl transferase [Chloroflexi bacterium]|nr:prolipoprotein diacylglyceryl transferase [Chloroflexota bacterium]
MEFQREYIELFNQVQIRYYGIIIVLAMLIAAWVAARLAKRSGYDPDHVWGALTWAIIPGIVGARLWFILFPPSTLTAGCIENAAAGAVCQNTLWFLQNFFNVNNGAIAIWSGGLSIFGAVIGGALGTVLYLRRNKLPIWPWLDIAGVALPLGQAIGRWANFINQELYGIPTTLPWGITIQSSKRVAPYTSTIDFPAETLFHPLFLYESLWSMIAFFVLLNLYLRFRSRLMAGDIFLLYVIQYAFIRFFLEFIKVEPAYIWGTMINSSQVMSVVAFVAALGLFVYRHRPGLADSKTAAQSPAA